MSNTDHTLAAFFFVFSFWKRPLPAARGAERESTGRRSGFRRDGGREAAQGVWRSVALFVCLFVKVMLISVNPPAG